MFSDAGNGLCDCLQTWNHRVARVKAAKGDALSPTEGHSDRGNSDWDFVRPRIGAQSFSRFKSLPFCDPAVAAHILDAVGESFMRIAVTTPTGHIGNKLANLLLDRKADVTLIARHPEKVKDLTSRGAKVIAGEHSDAAVVSKR